MLSPSINSPNFSSNTYVVNYWLFLELYNVLIIEQKINPKPLTINKAKNEDAVRLVLSNLRSLILIKLDINSGGN